MCHNDARSDKLFDDMFSLQINDVMKPAENNSNYKLCDYNEIYISIMTAYLSFVSPTKGNLLK